MSLKRHNFVFACLLSLFVWLPTTGSAQLGGVKLLSQIDPVAGPGFYQDVWGYVAPDGREYALLGSGTGTNIIDVTDPENPVEITYIPGASQGWYDIKVYRNYAYITTEGTGPNQGLQIVDLSGLPATAPLVATYTGDPGFEFTHCHNVYIDTTRARLYICGGDVSAPGGMQMLDISDPVNPAHIASYTASYVHDLYVRNDTLFSCELGNGLTFIDVSGTSFNILANHTYPGNFTHNAWTTEDGHYVLTTDEIVDGRVKIWDMSDINNVSFVGDYTANPNAIIHNVYVRGDSAYISHYSEGLRVIDLADPANPREIGAYDTFLGGSGGFNGAWGVYPFLDSRNVLIGNMEDGLWIFELDGGLVAGTITDSQSGLPIEGVQVTLLETGDVFHSDSNGEYDIVLSEGNYTLSYRVFAYDSTGMNITVNRGLETDGDIMLVLTPTGDLSGTVSDGIAGIEGANIELDGTPLSTISVTAGAYTLNGVPVDSYVIGAAKFGHVNHVRNVNVLTGPNPIDFVLSPGFEDDFQYEQDWIIGAQGDSATEGIWERVDPNGVANGNLQPEDDHTPDGTKCYITGQAEPGASNDNSNDVDGGKTTLLTPTFDLTGMGNPTLTYYRYYYRQTSEDYFAADVSNNGGATWVNLETLTARENDWNEKVFTLSDFVTITGNMQIRFVVEDVGADSRVEAGLDDFRIDDIVVSVDDPGHVPAAYSLSQNFPNPFNPATTIQYSLRANGPVKLKIYDMLGHEVKTLVNDNRPAGTHQAVWDGSDRFGKQAASGVYFYKIETPGFSKTMKLVLMK